MKVAVANRPVEQFDTKVTLPEYQLEPDQESYFGEADNGLFVDENGVPLEPGVAPAPVEGQQVDQDGNALPRQPRPGERPEQGQGQGQSAGQDGTERPAEGEKLDQAWLDHVLGRETSRANTPARAPNGRQSPVPDPRPTQ
jgi:penicillin-binding protein 1A